MYYGQNSEDKLVAEWFGQYVGTLCEIGSNNGEFLSNSLHLISKGWKGVLVEPSQQVYHDLVKLHKDNPSVYLFDGAIGDKNGFVTFYDSGELLGKGDRALVSTVNKEETERWGSINMPFKETEVYMVTWDKFLEDSPYKTFDFISIDAEGNDIAILRQMDLDKLECRCLCVEHNSIPNNVSIIRELTQPLGFKQIGYNQENIILARS
jgi:FkbM family methyltransferase